MKNRKWMLVTEVQGHKFEVELSEVNLTLKQIEQFINLMGCKFRLRLV